MCVRAYGTYFWGACVFMYVFTCIWVWCVCMCACLSLCMHMCGFHLIISVVLNHKTNPNKSLNKSWKTIVFLFFLNILNMFVFIIIFIRKTPPKNNPNVVNWWGLRLTYTTYLGYSGYVIGWWAGRYCVRISIWAPTQSVFKGPVEWCKATTPSSFSLTSN